MVKIRLTRTGRKKLPAYRIVVADSRSARDGRFIEQLGWYQPLNKEKAYEVDGDKALKWLKQGAVPSDTVKSLLRQAGVLKIFHDFRCELAAARKGRKADAGNGDGDGLAEEEPAAEAQSAPAEEEPMVEGEVAVEEEAADAPEATEE